VSAIDRVAVIGAGTMGHGIAQVSARAGCQVKLYDVDPRSLERALVQVRQNLDKGVEKGKVSAEERQRTLEGLATTNDLEEAAREADLVVEAIPERMELKKTLFARLAGICRQETILASNTSSLSLTEMAEVVVEPSRAVGLHFFNPPHIMPLLEVVLARQTSADTLARVRAYAERIGKTAIVVRDSPGFATSRLGIALGMEAIRMLQDQVATAEDIDRAMELGYGHPVGPLRLTDLVGLDVRLAIAEYLEGRLGEPQFKPPELLRKMVAEGKLGKKSGQGFYKW
jgi:3-hydroxybutyryl-CoA dehydrogenase